MRREGWKHGMTSKFTKATAGAGDCYVKAPSKPTNHSKHTGKCKKARCGQCHLHPVSKSKDKAKGTYKLKSGDVVLNHRLVSWRVAGSQDFPWAKCTGTSATGVLDALLTDSCWSQGDDHEQEEYGYGYGHDEHATDSIAGCGDDVDLEVEGEEDGGGGGGGGGGEEEEEEDEEDMGFCEVGFVWEVMDEEGWCVVDEM